ncbi:MAG: hypothetical protein CL920_01905 [Deltaproteobacteria bacterium]|nr:hypothetical protein [Deltaproteobacteria bacterium]MBU47438.1 hypothetical protein [Deltaproteobacteria bacterium]
MKQTTTLLRRFLWICAFMCCSLCMLHCGAPERCKGRVGEQTLDPNGSPCLVDCECNNQLYEGHCQDNVCVGTQRETCNTKGTKRPCLLTQAGANGCTKGTQVCAPSYLSSSVWGDCQPIQSTPSESTQTLCFDGLDNDCDGKVDLGDADCKDFCNPGETRACFRFAAAQKGVGACKAGLQTCGEDRRWPQNCPGEQGPTQETCDGKDNDCDGSVDEHCPCPLGESRSCFSGLPSQADKGECKQGRQTCETKGWSACVGQTKPRAERCDQRDNDCDGQIDEDNPEGGEQCPIAGKKGLCGLGTLRCKEGKLLCQEHYTPTPETCNGKDDNCDGKVDENNPESQKPCQVKGQKGVCASGSTFCQAGTLRCIQQRSATREVCNGKDDDCDGETDEGMSAQPCYTGTSGCLQRSDGSYICEAPCQAGTRSCQQGIWSACTGQTLPAQQEACNGKDDNCNGKVDERFPQLGLNCFSGLYACRTEGTFVCSADGLGVVCNAKPPAPVAELCNNKDDDCDGTVDNNIKQVGTVCNNTQTGSPCKQGTYICKGGTLICNAVPQQEICNGKDDDCDGQVDDIPPQQCPYTGPAYTQDIGSCKAGFQLCQQGKMTACTGEVRPASGELCGNNIDDDCNGTIDDLCKWHYTLPMSASNSSYSTASVITTDQHDNVYVAGEYQGSFTIQNKTYTSKSTNQRELFILSLDPSGRIRWVTTVSTNPVRQIGAATISVSVNVTSGQVTVNGLVFGNTTLQLANSTLTVTGGSTAFSLVFDSQTGKDISAKTIASNNIPYNADATDTTLHSYFTRSFTTTYTLGPTTYTSKGQSDLMLLKRTNLGQIVWGFHVGSPVHDTNYAVALDPTEKEVFFALNASGKVSLSNTHTIDLGLHNNNPNTPVKGTLLVRAETTTGNILGITTLKALDASSGFNPGYYRSLHITKGNLYVVGSLRGKVQSGSQIFSAPSTRAFIWKESK